MSNIQEAMHNHHQTMAETLDKHVAALVAQPETADTLGLVEFLQRELLPHAKGEEAHLYPAVDPLIKAHGSATATMSVDHAYIERYIQQIATATKDVQSKSGTEQAAASEHLKHLALQLQAIFQLHLEKEETVYLPLFETYVSPEQQQHILDAMHDYDTPAHPQQTIDVRQIPPAQRHPLIFNTFAALDVGEVFRLVNDHDPKPLFYQFKFELEGQFSWEYVESGPTVWQVNIGKIAVGQTA